MFGVMNQRGTVMVSKTAVVDVAELARRQFSERLERYRSLVAAAADREGQLPAAQVEEFLAVASQLGIPADRLGRDIGSLVARRNLEARVAEIREANERAVADVPQLEAELAELSQEFMQAKRRMEMELERLEGEMNKRRAEIAREQRRPRQSPASLELQLRRLHEGNPVMFAAGVAVSDLPRLLGVRQSAIGDVF
jgi:chromosome segregation ATPase